jgi:hypothetical protein
MNRLMLVLLCLVLTLTACSGQHYTPPEACIGPDGQVEHSLILENIPDPAGTSLLLQIANAEAIDRDLYSAADALTVIERIEGYVQDTYTYADLLSQVVGELELANRSAGVMVFALSGYALDNFDTPLPVSDCDRALLLAHLAKQRAVVLMMGAR